MKVFSTITLKKYKGVWKINLSHLVYLDQLPFQHVINIRIINDKLKHFHTKNNKEFIWKITFGVKSLGISKKSFCLT